MNRVIGIPFDCLQHRTATKFPTLPRSSVDNPEVTGCGVEGVLKIVNDRIHDLSLERIEKIQDCGPVGKFKSCRIAPKTLDRRMTRNVFLIGGYVLCGHVG